MREEDEEQLSRPEEENIKPTDYKNVPEMDIPPLPIPDILVFFFPFLNSIRARFLYFLRELVVHVLRWHPPVGHRPPASSPSPDAVSPGAPPHLRPPGSPIPIRITKQIAVGSAWLSLTRSVNVNLDSPTRVASLIFLFRLFFLPYSFQPAHAMSACVCKSPSLFYIYIYISFLILSFSPLRSVLATTDYSVSCAAYSHGM